ncbi:hypothetical protein G6F40_014143 [Rhizopus arrhizus]|nr:hypothetical protein G6F40_014143 [Rhizopus arrhizus]
MATTSPGTGRGLRRQGVLHLQRRTAADARAGQQAAGRRGGAAGGQGDQLQDRLSHRRGLRAAVAVAAPAWRTAVDPFPGRAAVSPSPGAHRQIGRMDPRHPTARTSARSAMLHYAVIFFVIAIIAAVLGFSGIAGAASNIAWILFVVFLVLAVISMFRKRG